MLFGVSPPPFFLALSRFSLHEFSFERAILECGRLLMSKYVF